MENEMENLVQRWDSFVVETYSLILVFTYLSIDDLLLRSLSRRPVHLFIKASVMIPNQLDINSPDQYLFMLSRL